jgi:DNA recombination protein RmuC
MVQIQIVLEVLILAGVLGLFFRISARRGESPTVLGGDLTELRREIQSNLKDLERTNSEALGKLSTALAESMRVERGDINGRLDAFAKTLNDVGAEDRREANEGRAALENSLTTSIAGMNISLTTMRSELDKQLSTIALKVETELNRVRESNETKLDEMRMTVDEKLHGTLEKRLGESFAMVSERLEAVSRGLGEMQQLASGVGDLKRVLTNVKSRGVFGEVQLDRLLSDTLTPDQYLTNVAVDPLSRERVEFAIKLPGREDEVVLLPIDAKFPTEDYERLQAAQEIADVTAIEAAAKDLERRIRNEAKTIHEKYIKPPATTDFAIMFLPTEGLFAEVVRRPGLTNELQRLYHVMVTGPTTILALLNSLQMGFRTLAIEKSASEVWKVLSAARVEFGKYAEVVDKVGRQLGTVQTSMENLGQRSRAVERSLRSVELGDPSTSSSILGLPELVPDDELEN